MVHFRPETKHEGVKQVLDRMLDKGIVVDARVRAFLVDQKLIEVRAIITLASFETAARLVLPFPKGINFETRAWKELLTKEACPQCKKKVFEEELRIGCPWCGYKLGDDLN